MAINRFDICNKPNLISDLVFRLNYSADLVERASEYKFSNGDTIRDKLTVDGISFWDLFTAELSHIHLSQVFLSGTSSNSFLESIKPQLIRIKYLLKHYLNSWNVKKESNSWPGDDAFIYLGFTNRMYVDILFPLISVFKKEFKNPSIVLMDNDIPSRKKSIVEDCTYQKMWEHWDSDAREYAKELQSKLQLRINDIDIRLFVMQILPEEDREYLTGGVVNLFRKLLKAYLPNVIKYVVVTKHILERHKPAIVISPDTADSRTRVFSLLAKSMGIPCLDIQFGLAGEEAVEWRFLLSDCVAVWGESSKQAMLKQKISEDRIVKTGSPRHDILINHNPEEILNKKRALSIPAKSKVVLLASTYHFRDTNHADVTVIRSMQLAIAEAVDKSDDVFLIVKPHPHEDVKETKSIFPASPKVLFADKDSDIRQLISLCDAFISYGSTATIDALIADRLIICPIFPGWVFSSDIFKESGATLNPTTKEEILDIFKSFTDDSYLKLKNNLELARCDFLRNYIFEVDGRATERIKKLINGMINNNQSMHI